MLVITHYQRLNYIVPDYVHILLVVKFVGRVKKLALEVEGSGYAGIGVQLT